MAYIVRRFAESAALAILLGMVGSAPVQGSSYKVTDLGMMTTDTPTYLTDSQGRGLVLSTDGTTGYAYQTIPDRLATLGADSLSSLSAPYANDGNGSSFRYSYFRPMFMDSDGRVLGQYLDGVAGHGTTDYGAYSQRQPDGSWGPLVKLWSGATHYTEGYAVDRVVGLSDTGTALGMVERSVNYAVIADLNTGRTFDFASISQGNLIGHTGLPDDTIPLTNIIGSWNVIQPIGIDAMGRILLEAQRTDVDSQGADLLLLSPDGVAADPIPVPEVSTLSMFGLASLAFLARRMRASRAA